MKFTRRDFFKSLGSLGLGFLPGTIQESVVGPTSAQPKPIESENFTAQTGGSAGSFAWAGTNGTYISSASCSFSYPGFGGTPFNLGQVYTARQRLEERYKSLGVKTSKYDQWAKEVKSGNHR